MKFGMDVIRRSHSEAEIQAVAYTLLLSKLQHYYVRAGWKYKKIGERGCIFDIAIFNSALELVLIIEIKRSPKTKAHKQHDRYNKVTGVPVLVIGGMVQAQYIVPRVTAILRGKTTL